MRTDDVSVHLVDDHIEVHIGGTRVGVLDVADRAKYAPVLQQVDCAVESSGIVLIDAAGHPGPHVKLYLPDPHMLVPANVLDQAVPLFPAHDRAGGVTLARRKADHALIESATASWWSGTARSAWVVLTRSDTEITATMDGLALPPLPQERSAGLQSAWDALRPGQRQLQFEAQVYPLKAGRQINVRHQLVY